MKKIVMVLFMVVSSSCIADVAIDKIVRVYDGDTIYVNLKDTPDIFGKNIGIRVNGIDTPEIRTRCKNEKALGYKAKAILVEQLEKASCIELRNEQRGKYFRLVADVYADGVDVTDKLLQSGLAVEYNGGTKNKDWCGYYDK